MVPIVIYKGTGVCDMCEGKKHPSYGTLNGGEKHYGHCSILEYSSEKGYVLNTGISSGRCTYCSGTGKKNMQEVIVAH